MMNDVDCVEWKWFASNVIRVDETYYFMLLQILQKY